MTYKAREFSTADAAHAWIATLQARYPDSLYKVITLATGKFCVAVQQSAAAYALCA